MATSELGDSVSLIDTGLLLTTTVIGLFLAVIYHHLNKFSFWSSRGIKGPTPWPLVGTNIYYLFRNRVEVDEEWREKYGDVYGIYNGYNPSLRISDNELIRHVYIEKFPCFTDRDNKYFFGENVRNWPVWSAGAYWANQRALITPLFTGSKMRNMLETMQSCMTSLKQEIESRLSESNETGETRLVAVISKDELMGSTLDVVGRTIFGLKLNTYRDKTSEFFKRAYAFANFDVARLMVWLVVPQKLAEYLKFDLIAYSKYEYFDKLSQSTINERRRLGASGKRNDLVQSLLDARLPDESSVDQPEKAFTEEDDLASHYNDNTDHRQLQAQHEMQQKQARSMRHFDDLEIRGQMTFFFLAGLGTTSSSLSFCFYELAHQQEAQQEVYDELRASLAESGGELDYGRIMELKKLDAFLSEALRLYSPVTEHIRSVTAKEGVILPTCPPIKLPYGFPISAPGLVIQRHPKYWKNPLKFDMSRFYPENRDQLHSCSYMPFGIGPRNCAGMRFALLDIKLCLTEVLAKYHVSPGPNSQQYPPEFNRHAFFLQLKHTDFKLTRRP